MTSSGDSSPHQMSISRYLSRKPIGGQQPIGRRVDCSTRDVFTVTPPIRDCLPRALRFHIFRSTELNLCQIQVPLMKPITLASQIFLCPCALVAQLDPVGTEQLQIPPTASTMGVMDSAEDPVIGLKPEGCPIIDRQR